MSSTGRYLPVGLQGLMIARRPKSSPEPGWLIFFLPSASAARSYSLYCASSFTPKGPLCAPMRMTRSISSEAPFPLLRVLWLNPRCELGEVGLEVGWGVVLDLLDCKA